MLNWLVFQFPSRCGPSLSKCPLCVGKLLKSFSTNPFIHKPLPDSVHLRLPDGWGWGEVMVSGPRYPVSTLIQSPQLAGINLPAARKSLKSIYSPLSFSLTHFPALLCVFSQEHKVHPENINLPPGQFHSCEYVIQPKTISRNKVKVQMRDDLETLTKTMKLRNCRSSLTTRNTG